MPPLPELLSLSDELAQLDTRRDALKVRVAALRDELAAIENDTRDGQARLLLARTEVASREQLVSPEQTAKPVIAKIVIALATFAGVLSFAAGRCGG